MNFLVYIYIYIYIFLVFPVCVILFHFILLLSNFTPFGRVVFSLFGVLVCSCCRGQFQWVRDCKSRLNLNPMEEGQYGQHVAGGNLRAYMTIRDYRNLAWQNQQPVERNPNPCRSMREYRDQWMSTPSYSVTPTYAPPPHPQYASLSQPQPPQPISPVEQAILDLTKLVGDAVEEQNKFNAQLSQKIHTVENSLEHKLDGLQSEVGKQFDSLQCSISRLTQQHVH